MTLIFCLLFRSVHVQIVALKDYIVLGLFAHLKVALRLIGGGTFGLLASFFGGLWAFEMGGIDISGQERFGSVLCCFE